MIITELTKPTNISLNSDNIVRNTIFNVLTIKLIKRKPLLHKMFQRGFNCLM